MFHCNGGELPPSRPAAVETRAVWERHAPASEPIANSLLASLLLEDLVPEGGILDVGAFDGVFANFYAELMPHRTIYAIDPSMENIKKMRLPKQARNLCSLWGAVGEADEAAQVNLTDAEANGSQPVRDRGYHYVNERRRRFPIYSLDTLFARTRMGFLCSSRPLEGQPGSVTSTTRP